MELVLVARFDDNLLGGQTLIRRIGDGDVSGHQFQRIGRHRGKGKLAAGRTGTLARTSNLGRAQEAHETADEANAEQTHSFVKSSLF